MKTRNYAKSQKERLKILSKNISRLRILLERIERQDDYIKIAFLDVIGGFCVFLENEFDPDLKTNLENNENN